MKPLYGAHFGLPEAPFSLAPDPRFLYLSPGHEEALAHLRWGLAQAGAFVVLTGEVGTGKSTVLAALLADLDPTVAVAYVLNPRAEVPALLSSIARDFQFPALSGETLTDPLERIYAGLLAFHGEGRQALLLIDEAQLLSDDALEQLRLLTNLETRERKLLQIILVGQPELRTTLAKASLRQLAQRITARYHLEPLAPRALEALLRHRLAVAGALTQPFRNDAFRALHRASQGIPRIANLIADRALLAAYGAGESTVSALRVREAAQEVRGTADAPRRARWPWALGAVVLIALAGLFALQGNPALDTPREIAPAPPPGVPDPAPAPQGFDRSTGLAALLDTWRSPRPAAKPITCAALDALGFGCLETTPPLWQLLSFDRPALLRLRGEADPPRWGLLTGLRGTHLLLDLGAGPEPVERPMLDAHWDGHALLLWQRPPEDEQAAWVTTRLRAQGYGGPQALRRFQADHGLTSGGTLTAESIMALNRGTPGVPGLQRE